MSVWGLSYLGTSCGEKRGRKQDFVRTAVSLLAEEKFNISFPGPAEVETMTHSLRGRSEMISCLEMA